MPNPFETLGLTPSYALDSATLEQRQRELNRALHPDRHARSGSGERRRALSRSMDINQACRVLRDPVTRGEALLACLGAEGALSSSRQGTPPSLLMEMMEQREALADAQQRGDEKAIAALAQSLVERQRSLQARLSDAFASAQSTRQSGAEPELAAVLQLLGELRYVRRFADEVAAVQDEL